MNASLKCCSIFVPVEFVRAGLALLLLMVLPCAAVASERVVCLTPALAEVAADVLGESLDAIVGVTDATDRPAGLSHVERVGPYHRFSLEKVVALKPTVILASRDGNPPDRVLKLKKNQFKVEIVDTSRLALLPDMVKRVGEALGRPDEAARWTEVWSRKLKEFETRGKIRSQSRPPERAVVIVGHDPLFVAAKQTFLSDVVEVLGARNVFEDLDKRYVQISREEILQRRPAIVIDVSGSGISAAISKWGTAKLVRIPPDDLLRPSRRMLDGMRDLEKAMYGS